MLAVRSRSSALGTISCGPFSRSKGRVESHLRVNCDAGVFDVTMLQQTEMKRVAMKGQARRVVLPSL
jgi:hypothetical protein